MDEKIIQILFDEEVDGDDLAYLYALTDHGRIIKRRTFNEEAEWRQMALPSDMDDLEKF